MARVALGAAACVVLGAALVGPYPVELRGSMLAGAVGILLWLAGEHRRR